MKYVCLIHNIFNNKCKYLNLLEKVVSVQVVRELGEELGQEDEVRLCQQAVLVQTEYSKSSLEEKLLPIPDEQVPDPASDIQGSTLAE